MISVPHVVSCLPNSAGLLDKPWQYSIHDVGVDGCFGGNNVAYQHALVSVSITNVVPEPSTVVLLTAVLAGVMVMARRRRTS